MMLGNVEKAIGQLKALNKRAYARDVIDLLEILLELLESERAALAAAIAAEFGEDDRD